MNKILVFIICVFLVSCSAASITPRTGTIPEGICTRDINQWGQSGNCSCKEGETYDERAGLCLTAGVDEEIIVQGAIATGMVAIGGETSGIEIRTTEGVVYELILKILDQEKLQSLSGVWFEVTGNVVVIDSVEMKERKVIIVNSLNVLE